MKTLLFLSILLLSWIEQSSVKNINFDYRNVVIGSYNSKEYHKYLNLENMIVYDTSNYILTISKKSNTDSFLILTTRERIFDVKLIGNSFRASSARCFGRFSGDSIYLTYIPSLGPTSYRYFGKK